jgi:hypothetical protein
MIDTRITAPPYDVRPRNISRPADKATLHKPTVWPVADHAGTRSPYNYLSLPMRAARKDCPTAVQPARGFDMAHFAMSVRPDRAAGCFVVLPYLTKLPYLRIAGWSIDRV